MSYFKARRMAKQNKTCKNCKNRQWDAEYLGGVFVCNATKKEKEYYDCLKGVITYESFMLIHNAYGTLRCKWEAKEENKNE